jgi:hypothetical protein
LPIPRALRAIGASALTSLHRTLSDDPMNRRLIDRLAGWRGLAGPAVLAVALAVPAARAAGGCDIAPSPPAVTLVPVFDVPVTDISLDLAALQRTARGSASPHREFSLLLGLTTVQQVGSYQEEIEYGAAPADALAWPVCGVTRKLQLRLGFEQVVVHIAREVTGDGCLYGEVYQHESRHVAVDRALLAEYAPRVAVVMSAAVAAIGVVRGDSPDAVARTIHQRVQAAFAAEFNAVEQERDRRQRLVDQPEEYRRISAACGGAAARLVGAILRPPG